MKHDDAAWHDGADDFPDDAPEEHGAVHIGVFAGLMFERGFVGSLHRDLDADAVAKVVSGEMPATAFVMDLMDGKLTDETFDDEGNRLAEAYYTDGLGPDGATFMADFAEHAGVELYEAPEEAANVEALRRALERRLAAFGDSDREGQR